MVQNTGPEKVEILIDMRVKPSKGKFYATLVTRAGFSQPQKFQPITVEMDADCTIGGFRRSAALQIHGATNIDQDHLLRCTLKSDGLLITCDLDSMTLKSWMKIKGGTALNFNMTVDDYGDGGGKRAPLTGPH